MKHKSFSFLLALLMSMAVSIASAEDFSVDGIYYSITSSTEPYTVAVTYRGYSYDLYSNEYTGSVTIPESVTYNGKTYSVTSIDYSAFAHCTFLTSIEIPNSVAWIGDEAFRGCSGLTSVEIPNSVTSIGSSTFYNCSGLTSVVIPNSVTSIGDTAFYGCTGLTSVEIPNSVTSIGNLAFYNCTGLTSVVIGNNVSSIGSGAFYGTAWYNNQPDGLVYAGKVAYKYKGTMPEGTEIVLEKGTLSITGSAFSGCSGLTSIEIPNSVTSIGEWAFSSCSGLTSIVVENGNTKYDSRNGCNAIIETASNTLVAGCKNTTIPNSVASIGYGAFRGCTRLTSIEIPNSVTSIGESAFQSCTKLTSVTVNSNVITSEAYTTSSNISKYFGTQVTSYTFGGGVKTIGTNACYGLTSLKSVSIGVGVTSIGKDAFKDCTGLAWTDYESIESLLRIKFENAAANPLSLTKALNVGGKIVTELEIPESVAAINSFAFYNCNSIKKVTGGKNVTSIGKSAFSNNVKLTSVQIGGKVEEIKDYAFNKCPLTTIYNYAATPQNCGIETFSIDKSTCNLYVLPESVEQYESHQDWYEFNINAMDAETVGVEAIENGQLTMNNAKGVYDLSGRRMSVNDNVNVNNSKFEIQNSKLKKGIYIVNGRKTVVR